MALPALNPRSGSALLEAVVATGLLIGVLTGLLPLTTTAAQQTTTARLDLLAAHLARQRLGELQALTHVTAAGGVLTDVSTRLDHGGFGAGGTGLTPTGMAPLSSSLPGASDWLDARGRLLPWSATPPPDTRYARRWAVVDDGSGCVRMWVLVSVIGRPLRAHTVDVAAVQCPWGVGQP